MRSVRRLVVVAATILAISVLAPSVSAHSHNNFHLEKTCVDNFTCVVQSSSFKGFPAGTQITYTYNGDGSDGLAYPTIHVRHGSTTGICDWNQPVGPVLAKCTFKSGTGRLTGIHLKVDVTFDNTTWFWDGTLWFSHHHHHHGHH